MSPQIEYGQLAPMLIVFGAAVVGVLVEAFAPRHVRYHAHLILGFGSLTAAFVAVVALAGTRHAAAMGAVVVDGPTLFLQGTILAVSALSLLMIAQRHIDRQVEKPQYAMVFTPQASAVPGSADERAATAAGVAQTEVFPLTLLAVGGMLLFPAAGDLLTLFVALEVFSLPLYLLCGLARRRRLASQESAMKYFLLGAFSSAILLYGVAMLYGYAGTVTLSGIGAAVRAHQDSDSVALLGVALVAVGLLFKVGAAPFHSWIPDVYQGAPTPVTAFMAAATKIAAFGALLRLFVVAMPALHQDWRPILSAIAVLTMVGGAVAAVTQTDVKRMLGYSAVAHTGFILTGLIPADHAGTAATLFYLAAYGFSTLGAFAIVGLVRDSDGEVNELARWAGLGQRSPLIAALFGLFLLTFAGIPLTSGFVGKFAVFNAAADAGMTPLVVVGVVSSAIAAFFYVRVIVLMFFAAPATKAGTPSVATPGIPGTTVLALSTIVTVVLGIAPQPLLNLADRAAEFLH